MKTLCNNTSPRLVISLATAMLLSACGGGGSTSSTTESTTNSYSQPRAISASDWQQTTNLQARLDQASFNVEDTGSQLKFTFDLPDHLFGENIQVYMNTDRNRQTGFGFDNQAWGEIGADYIVENGYLYKSLENSSDWAWDESAGLLEDYTRTDTLVEMIIDKQQLGNPCSKIEVGVMSRDSDWYIETLYPVASALGSFAIQACDNVTDTTPPVITLLGAQNLTVPIDSLYVDAGATAFDDVDGDLTTQISVTSSNAELYDDPTFLVDTSLEDEEAEIVYTVSDAAGNEISASRIVTVGSYTGSLVIDGQVGDWDYLDTEVTRISGNNNTHLLITQDDDYMYIGFGFRYIANAPNFQIFLDSDVDNSTGYHVWDAISANVNIGADYLIETGYLEKYIGPASYAWTWENQGNQIHYARGPSWAEMRIPLSIIEGEGVTMSVYAVDEQWSNYTMLKQNYYYPINVSEEIE